MSALEYSEIDLNKAVERWSADQVKASHPYLKGRKLLHQCDFSKVKFIDLPPTYENVQGKVKSEILYEAKFRNHTDREQKFLFKMDKNTSAVSKITLNRALIKDGKTRLSMSELPSKIASAPGFNDQFAVEGIGGEQYKENLSWGVDTYVTVYSESSLQATLTVDEMSYAAHFSVITVFVGEVVVNVVDAASGLLITTQKRDLLSILTEYYPVTSDQTLQIPGHLKGPVFKSVGYCQFRLGITQNINIADK